MNWIHRRLCRSANWKAALEHKLLPWVLDGLDLGNHLLELGPGPGLTTDILRTRVAHLTAIEIDPQLAGALGQRLVSTNVSVVEGDACQMQFANHSFSSAVALTMLHHVPSLALQDRLFAEVHRVLKPGAVFAGTDNTGGSRFWLIHLGDTLVPVDPDTLASRLERAGFGHIAIERSGQRFRFQAVRGHA